MRTPTTPRVLVLDSSAELKDRLRQLGVEFLEGRSGYQADPHPGHAFIPCNASECDVIVYDPGRPVRPVPRDSAIKTEHSSRRTRGREGIVSSVACGGTIVVALIPDGIDDPLELGRLFHWICPTLRFESTRQETCRPHTHPRIAALFSSFLTSNPTAVVRLPVRWNVLHEHRDHADVTHAGDDDGLRQLRALHKYTGFIQTHHRLDKDFIEHIHATDYSRPGSSPWADYYFMRATLVGVLCGGIDGFYQSIFLHTRRGGFLLLPQFRDNAAVIDRFLRECYPRLRLQLDIGTPLSKAPATSDKRSESTRSGSPRGWITLREAAEKYDVPYSTLHNYVTELKGDKKNAKRQGTEILLRTKALDRLLKAKRRNRVQ